MRVTPTPDGTRYLALAEHRRVPRPFNLRWLVPLVCGQRPARWVAVTIGSSVLVATGTGLLAPTWQTGIAAALMVAALPFVRFNLGAPILVDMPAMACAVFAAVAWQAGLWPVAVLLAIVSGACKESGPVFAACYAWTPILLVGLVAPAVRAVIAKTGPDPLAEWRGMGPGTTAADEHAWILAHPVAAGWKYHRAKWLNGLVMVTPWGAAVVGLAALDWQLGIVLAVAYGQLMVATDSVRLYQWAAPLMCIAAAGVVPVAWLPVLVVLTVWNPLAGNGV